MDDTPFYPPVNEKNIPVIFQLYDVNPEYFDHPECPYTQATKDLFKGDSKILGFGTTGSSGTPMSDEDTIEQISSVYQQMKDYGTQVLASGSSTDKNTYFRVSVSLLERIVTIKEKMSNLKSVNLFISETLTIMEDILNTEQRVIVMDKLKSFKSRLDKE